MSKRFTETEKWKDPWFCGLNEKQKLFWIYLVDNCDHAGIWQANWPLVEFYIKGYKHDSTKFEGRILYINENKWFIKKFIDFQYNGKLNPDNRTHKSVLDILEKEGAYKGLTSPTQGRKGTGTVLDKGTDNDLLIKINEVFDFFCITLQKKLILNKDRSRMILVRLQEGRTVQDLKQAITNFSKDDWPDRHKFCDLVYAIGIRNKVDNLDKWLQGPKSGPVAAVHPKDCPDCWGTGFETAIGSGKQTPCRKKF